MAMIDPKYKTGSIAPILKVRYHKEQFPDIQPIECHGNFIDLRSAEQVVLKAGEFTLINLGVSVKIPEGYWMQIVPRSSTYKKFHIIQTNSFGVIDTEYCGDNDILMMPVYATTDTVIPVNERICQFRLVRDVDMTIEEVDKLTDPDRGGFGHSDEVK